MKVVSPLRIRQEFGLFKTFNSHHRLLVFQPLPPLPVCLHITDLGDGCLNCPANICFRPMILVPELEKND